MQKTAQKPHGNIYNEKVQDYAILLNINANHRTSNDPKPACQYSKHHKMKMHPVQLKMPSGRLMATS